jgi:alcohol dehydrogenase class IV
MVNDFVLNRVPRILFGYGKFSQLPELITTFGDNPLILTGRESFLRTEMAEGLIGTLKKSGINVTMEHVIQEPSPRIVDDMVKKYSAVSVPVVVSIGGGSVIDAGKAVSAMLPLKEPVKEYIEAVGTRRHSGVKIPFIAVPTTAGTGSETTNNSVLSETGPEGFKRSLRHENLMPDIALVDPSLTFSCSSLQTAISGMDAFTQLLESFFSTRCNDFTDALALEGILHIKNSLKRAVSLGSDTEARAGMSYAAMLSGITITNAGLGLVHGFASSIGGRKDIPHGVICGTLMGSVNRHIVEKLLKEEKPSAALEKVIRLGKLLSGAGGRTDEDYAFFVANYIESLVQDLNIPTLSSYGLSEEDITAIVQTTDHKNNPVVFTPDELKDILMTRI